MADVFQPKDDCGLHMHACIDNLSSATSAIGCKIEIQAGKPRLPFMACTNSDTQKIRDVGAGLTNNELRVWDEGRGTRDSSSRVSPRRKKHGYFSLQCI